MTAFDQIKTIVIVMMENRSFDHVLGHLRMPEYGNRKDVEGLDDPTDNPKYVNFLSAQGYAPFPMKDQILPHDLPHGRDFVKTQLAESNGTLTMSGFVKAYKEFTGSVVNEPPPMGFLAPQDVPISSFFAEQYTVCDHWFSPLPADTQPNRSVAFSGYSLIEDTKGRPIPVPPESFIFEWLTRHKVSWRVYHSGLSFFMLFQSFKLPYWSNFSNIRDLAGHIASPDQMPQVIFIEPEYGDSPVHSGPINDNHPPTQMGPGEHFLREMYATLSKLPEKWNQTLMIVTYDEHGGFFDHVPPPKLRTPAPLGALFSQPFESMGPRVPAMLVSPFMKKGGVFNGMMDHTSILQFLAEKFTPGKDYNDEVKRRREFGIQSVSAALRTNPDTPRSDTPLAPADQLEGAVLTPPATEIQPGNQEAFAVAARQLLAQDRICALQKFPELLHLPDK